MSLKEIPASKENKKIIDKENIESNLNDLSMNHSVSNVEISNKKTESNVNETVSRKSKASKEISFSDIYKTSSLLKSSTSEFIKQEEEFNSSDANEKNLKEFEQKMENQSDTSNQSNLQGLSLDWCLGLNTSCLNNVKNLTTEIENNIFYTSGNTGILYDYQRNKQILFQGHTDSISSVCYNLKQNIMVTADSGESCLMVVWDAKKGIPLKTFFEPHESGVAVVDISPCGK